MGHIFDLYGSLSPGAITLLKVGREISYFVIPLTSLNVQGAMVTNFALAAVCVENGLHKHIIYESPTLGVEIENYVEQLKRGRDLEYKIADNEGRPPGRDWIDIEPPKVLTFTSQPRAQVHSLHCNVNQPLSDIVESTLLGLLVLDNFKSQSTARMYNKILKPFFEKHISLQTLAHHPTKVLFEMFQSRGCQHFEIAEGPEGGEDAEGNPLGEGQIRCDGMC